MKKIKLLIALAVMLTLSVFMLTACPNGYHVVTWEGAEVTATVNGEVVSGDDVRHGSSVVFAWGTLQGGYAMRVQTAGVDTEVAGTTWTLSNVTEARNVVFTIVPVAGTYAFV
ncbi:MAG: hypothetical protein FWC11_01150, partial [Firmicutes bacterium]|nr:hypothetical protein [Bacillota bacterium]